MNNYLDLFSGIGGFALGAYRAGLRFDRHYYSEVDDYAIKVYERRFPDAIGLGDICNIRGEDLPRGDWIITGGFPCQDISVAGKGAGLAGKRSGLWFEYARLISELRPRYAVMENVGALTFRGLDRVLGSLAEVGYDAEWQDIRASDVGAPHRRERIWIVAYPHALRESRSTEPREQFDRAAQSDGSCGDRMETGDDVAYPAESRQGKFYGGYQERLSFASNNGKNVADSASERCRETREYQRDGSTKWITRGGKAMADPKRERLEERRSAEPTEETRTKTEYCGEAMADASNGGYVRRNGKLEPAQGQMREHRGSAENGSGEWWATEPDVGRVAHGIPSRVDRLKCLGNSIVPQIAEMIFRQSAFDEWRTDTRQNL